jgi:hypothetical protein
MRRVNSMVRDSYREGVNLVDECPKIVVAKSSAGTKAIKSVLDAAAWVSGWFAAVLICST